MASEPFVRASLGDCRFYEQRFPKPDDLVMVIVRRIADMGAYVSLLEYNNIEGMILMSELSKRRFRSVSKLIRVGKTEVVMVLRVDESKGYIDLSKRRVSPEDIVKCEEKYSIAKLVQTIVRHVAQTKGMTVDELNSRVTWPLDRKYGSAHEAFKEAVAEPDEVFGGLDVAEDVKEALLSDIKRRLTPQAIKLRVRLDVCCFGYEGVTAVKDALMKAHTISTEGQEMEMSVKLIAPPQYVLIGSCLDRQLGMKKMKEAMDLVKDEITRRGGTFVQKSEIIVVGGEDERHLNELLREAAEDEEGDEEEESDEEQDETMGEIGEDVPEDEVEGEDGAEVDEKGEAKEAKATHQENGKEDGDGGEDGEDKE
ncbi:unnamed protein product [Vitrella brassicaformis CCMP3155]|uniref:Eukaryotic translation initiation factor 2 subunit 1 n=1 Tax=Vitrella brassicaformis (strain CCMP3155) TaxID=1169540 RepID=A0A0G4EMT8_VITBC|nr:unnamed protein product [Vitrella brassicaformis CCMP3155]|mmetsp:Transcript_11067/g.26755  ORF Transcript_11067/g.26755 Transcript_11067/m.26755 type:complete len:368 (-) Transcript_11067:220-1323(-)|eukprot:CEL99142.1 unnamed protein product [Vitrella brassicaformis CCMP3155]